MLWLTVSSAGTVGCLRRALGFGFGFGLAWEVGAGVGVDAEVATGVPVEDRE